MSELVGRQAQLATLNQLLEPIRSRVGNDRPGYCLLMRGRRRVGKSRLVETFAERSGVPTLYFTASRQQRGELDLFAEAVIESNLPSSDLFGGTQMGNWDAALRLLNTVLPDDVPSIIIFDEFPYFVEQDRSIEATFQKQWDRLLRPQRSSTLSYYGGPSSHL